MAYLFLERMPGRQIFVALLVLPTIISPIVAGATWRLLFDNRFGPINQIIGWFAGRAQWTLLWTINPNLVYPAIIFCEIWQWTPFMFLILLAALSNVDKSQLEAAEIDGAGFWRTFRKIVLPAIWPVMAIAILIRGLDLFRIFDIIWALTQGGPGTMTETISIYTYVQGFQQFETSYTAAIAFLVIAILTVVVHLGHPPHGAGEMSALPFHRRPGLRLAFRYVLAHDAGDRLPVPDLLAVHDFLQDAGRDLRLSAGLVSGQHPVRQLLRCCSRTATHGPCGTAWCSPACQHGLRHDPRHHRAYSLARFKTGGENLAIWIISQRMMPPIAIVFPIFLLYVYLGWVDTFHGLILLYTAFNLPYVIWMMRGYIEDIPLELEESALVDGCTPLAGAVEGGAARWRAPASSPPPSSPSSSPGTTSSSRWC